MKDRIKKLKSRLDQIEKEDLIQLGQATREATRRLMELGLDKLDQAIKNKTS